MSIINIFVAFASYLLLMILVYANSKVVRNILLIAAPALIYLFTYLSGAVKYIPSQMLGHAIAFIIGLMIYRSIDKQVKEAETLNKTK